MAKKVTAIRLTEECKRLYRAIAAKRGIGIGDVIELAVRDMARREKVK